MSELVPKIAQEAVLVASEPMPSGSQVVRGYDFSNGVDYHALLQSFKSVGFQANHFARAVEEINNMVSTRAQPFTPDSRKFSKITNWITPQKNKTQTASAGWGTYGRWMLCH